ncbi:MAG TPA: transposase, partial [Bacteroidota bacterium]|nr:transposase [Bacteroidota bacterium]
MLMGDARSAVRDHMSDYAAENRIELHALNVQPEHVHLSVRLSHDQRIEDISKLLKGESSHWINQN